ncbi:MAG: PPC domain-containing protein [Candidatus Goldbacteria bacterium]|nr:PPC domain-containing protein [Candidatus Goldiibacteriota bacterium]
MKKLSFLFLMFFVLIILFACGKKTNPAAAVEEPTPIPAATLAVVAAPDSFEPADSDPYSATHLVLGTASTGHTIHTVCDWDWYSFDAIAGQSYIIETYNLGANADTYLKLYASSNIQNSIFSDDDRCGFESYISWTCPATGKYFVSVSSYDCNSGTPTNIWSGIMDTSYSFRVSNVLPDTYETDNDVPGKNIIVGAAAQSHNNHQADDMDIFSFACTSGSKYTIETSGLGANSDTVLRLYDSTEILITFDDNSGAGGKASKISWTADYTGTAYIAEFQSVNSDWNCGVLGGTDTAYSITVTSP